jgi:hypothetical protein
MLAHTLFLEGVADDGTTCQGCGWRGLGIDETTLVEKGYLEHQATIAKLSAYMGVWNQVGA